MTGDQPPAREEHERFEILMMGFLDGELTAEDERRFQVHMETCESCKRELGRYRELTRLASSVQLREPQDDELDKFWQGLYNRMERGSGWTLLMVGVVLATIALVIEVFRTEFLSWWIKGAVAALALGFVVLFLSVLRARLRAMPFDRYREIHR